MRSIYRAAAVFLFTQYVIWPSVELAVIKKLSYSSDQVRQLREEVRANLKNHRNGNRIHIRFRKYKIQKGDNFFTVMARTMLNHDTLSSVNRLSSLWDVTPGETWYIPNMRGIAIEGELNSLARKYRMPAESLAAVPGRKDMFFIPGRQFDKEERSYFNLKAFIRPVDAGYISSKFGYRKDPFKDRKKFHKGIDIAVPIGAEVKASSSGRIIFSGRKGGYGNTVIIEHRNGYRTLYGHLSKLRVRKGQQVKQGQLIALSGNTGRSTGPHLHFEVHRKGKPVKPHF